MMQFMEKLAPLDEREKMTSFYVRSSNSMLCSANRKKEKKGVIKNGLKTFQRLSGVNIYTRLFLFANYSCLQVKPLILKPAHWYIHQNSLLALKYFIFSSVPFSNDKAAELIHFIQYSTSEPPHQFSDSDDRLFRPNLAYTPCIFSIASSSSAIQIIHILSEWLCSSSHATAPVLHSLRWMKSHLIPLFSVNTKHFTNYPASLCRQFSVSWARAFLKYGRPGLFILLSFSLAFSFSLRFSALNKLWYIGGVICGILAHSQTRNVFSYANVTFAETTSQWT